MNLIDVIKNKIKCKSKKAFGKNYAEFCEVEKKCSNVASFPDKALDKFARRNVKNTKTRSTSLSNNTIYHQLQLSKVDKYN